jgi:colanic acid/amylovoran biosynthesis glycosyltransferase
MNLFLFTTHFPLGRGEVFLETEILFLEKHFKKITIIPLFVSEFSGVRKIPANAVHTNPLISCRIDRKLALFLKGMLNRAPLIFAFREFMQKGVYKKYQWKLNWLSYTSITRAALSSTGFRNLVKQIKPGDILYFYWGDNPANLVPFIRTMVDNKIIVRFHRGDLYEEKKDNYLPYRVELLKNLDLAVFISNHGRRYLENRYPGIIKKTVVSRLGVPDCGTSQPGNGKTLHLVSCSNIVRVKRVNLIAAALRYLDFKVQWIHFGSGPLMDDLQRDISGLPDNIEVLLHGHVINQELMNFYRTSAVDLFINVSESEGLPVSIMEAFSMGIPVLATDSGGVPEIVSDRAGYLISNDASAERIAHYIRHFYERNDKATLRENARKIWEEKFDAEKNYKEFCEILTS